MALRLGANGLETDAWITADGKVVLDHDGVLRRFGRRVPIGRVRRADLPGHVPEISDLLVLDGGNFDLSVDVKDPDATDAIVETATRLGFDTSRLWLCFEDVDLALGTRRRLGGVRIVNSARTKKMPEGIERRAAILSENGVDALNMHHSDWTGGSVTLVHRFSLHAFGWDLQQEHVLSAGLRMGLDAVYSDRVDAMVDVYSREIGCSPRRN